MLKSIEHEIPTPHKRSNGENKDISCFIILGFCINSANKSKNANNCWHFNIYKQDKFHAQLSMKKVYLINSVSVCEQ